MHAVVVAFDRLPVSLLGCYGATWIDTPAFDRFASEATTFDACYASTDSLRTIGVLPCVRDGVFPLLLKAGIPVTLLGPESHVGDHSMNGVNAVVLDAELTPRGDPAPAILAAATDWFTHHRPDDFPSSLTWISVPWELPAYPVLPDGPLTSSFLEDFSTSEAVASFLTQTLGADFDVPESEDANLEWFADWIEPLQRQGLFDPDRPPTNRTAAAIRRAAATVRVSLLDIRLGQLLEALDDRNTETSPQFVAALGLQGDLLMHHPPVLAGLPPLVEERVHVPLWIRSRPGGEADAGTRRGGLASVDDIAATLRQWFPLATDEDSLAQSLVDADGGVRDGRHESLDVTEGAARSFRQEDLYTILHPSTEQNANDETPLSLFLKPDDVWDLQDIAPQIPDVAEQLLQQLRGFEEQP